MDHQRDGDVIGAADAVKMVLDVAEHKGDLVEVAQVVDHFQPVGACGRGVCSRRGEDSTNDGNALRIMLRLFMASSHACA